MLCLAAERSGAFVPEVILKPVVDAALVTNGPYAVSGCALMRQRTVECWGPNRNGEVGIGRRSQLAPRSAVPGLTAVAKVSAGPAPAGPAPAGPAPAGSAAPRPAAASSASEERREAKAEGVGETEEEVERGATLDGAGGERSAWAVVQQDAQQGDR